MSHNKIIRELSVFEKVLTSFWNVVVYVYRIVNWPILVLLFVALWFILRGDSQLFPDTKRQRKQTKPNKRNSNKRTKSTKISSLSPKRGNRNAKKSEKYNNKILSLALYYFVLVLFFFVFFFLFFFFVFFFIPFSAAITTLGED